MARGRVQYYATSVMVVPSKARGPPGSGLSFGLVHSIGPSVYEPSDILGRLVHGLVVVQVSGQIGRTEGPSGALACSLVVFNSIEVRFLMALIQLGMRVCHMTSRVRSDLIGQLIVICSQMTVLK